MSKTYKAIKDEGKFHLICKIYKNTFFRGISHKNNSVVQQHKVFAEAKIIVFCLDSRDGLADFRERGKNEKIKNDVILKSETAQRFNKTQEKEKPQTDQNT